MGEFLVVLTTVVAFFIVCGLSIAIEELDNKIGPV